MLISIIIIVLNLIILMITTRTVLLVSIEMLLVKVQQGGADSVLPLLQVHTRTPGSKMTSLHSDIEAMVTMMMTMLMMKKTMTKLLIDMESTPPRPYSDTKMTSLYYPQTY